MTTLTARVLAVLTAMAAALVLLAGCGGRDAAGEAAGGPDEPEAPLITGEPAGFNEADIAFATDMVPHHAQAIDLARTAAERSTNPEVVRLAEQIVAVAQPELNILNVFLVQWKENPENGTGADADSGAPDEDLPGTVDDATIARLGSLSGPEFDRLWLQSMISQNRGAIEIANAEIADGVNVDAVSIARTIVAGQQAQIAKMTQILEGMP
ncbi:DUF305 domain-containing protein [Mycobacterium sp. ITM-2016-00317]|uniref:DUF305 domain-containing protein n=1 Tax=Mycobacterium sp. ITM-2016-00317 TaxID=2099694 RepID=UPI00287F980D|nr:DUF305 domain-containing protein [Mycobacterium sp. ITM-2016-00317]WNG87911.1 DUF305 domain-containing protein [Mycobacterium sp. ITM-2016-00317]